MTIAEVSVDLHVSNVVLVLVDPVCLSKYRKCTCTNAKGIPFITATFIYYAIHTGYNSFPIDTWVGYVSIRNAIRRVITSHSLSVELH